MKKEDVINIIQEFISKIKEMMKYNTPFVVISTLSERIQELISFYRRCDIFRDYLEDNCSVTIKDYNKNGKLSVQLIKVIGDYTYEELVKKPFFQQTSNRLIYGYYNANDYIKIPNNLESLLINRQIKWDCNPVTGCCENYEFRNSPNSETCIILYRNYSCLCYNCSNFYNDNAHPCTTEIYGNKIKSLLMEQIINKQSRKRTAREISTNQNEPPEEQDDDDDVHNNNANLTNQFLNKQFH